MDNKADFYGAAVVGGLLILVAYEVLKWLTG